MESFDSGARYWISFLSSAAGLYSSVCAAKTDARIVFLALKDYGPPPSSPPYCWREVTSGCWAVGLRFRSLSTFALRVGIM